MNTKNDNYEENYSHIHCFDQKDPPPCGLKNVHTRCCLCEKKAPEAPQECGCGSERTEENCFDYHSASRLRAQPQDLEFVNPDGFSIADKTIKNGYVGEFKESPTPASTLKERFEDCIPHLEAKTNAGTYRKILSFIEAEVERARRCQKPIPGDPAYGNGICTVKLDCHLHDWRANKEELINQGKQSAMSAVNAAIEGMILPIPRHGECKDFARDTLLSYTGYNQALSDLQERLRGDK